MHPEEPSTHVLRINNSFVCQPINLHPVLKERKPRKNVTGNRALHQQVASALLPTISTAKDTRFLLGTALLPAKELLVLIPKKRASFADLALHLLC